MKRNKKNKNQKAENSPKTVKLLYYSYNSLKRHNYTTVHAGSDMVMTLLYIFFFFFCFFHHLTLEPNLLYISAYFVTKRQG